ncbi:ABC transporter permease [Paenibacillus sp. Aloe-11]|uniref:ABC transporter permease n=1 Tax=Paenibacillus sp. Aloe-11 TaxID=1050222 RepID=UPI00024EFDE6|nr:ABC transporter permease subunit [Paenibacillus sp. Aloe-11]EHS55943.1 binding-protein-dependent transport systems inner membrane component [Paenibacillus sp. Aloe-11]
MKTSITSRNRRFWIQCVSISLLILLWQLLSLSLPEIIFASPLETLRAIADIVLSGEFSAQLLISGSRMLAALSLGAGFGIICGVVAGVIPTLYEAIRPALSLLMGIPPIILVVLAMVWFGTGSAVPLFVVALLIFPGMYLNTADGMRSIDRGLLEMSQIYRVPFLRMFAYIIIPGLAVPIFTGFTLAVGSAVRITIMAELLGSDKGIGYSLALARVNMDTAKVFAWTAVSIILIIVIEHMVLRPLRQYIMRWNAVE